MVQVVERRAEIEKERETINHLVAVIEHEFEEMILGTRSVPEFEGLRKGTA